MSDYGIKSEWREAWRDVYQIYPWKLLADLAAHLLAKLMESEFRRVHAKCIPHEMVSFNPDKRWIEWSCGNPQPGHGCYDDAAWLEAARKYLSGGDDE